jgi:hypothetical protein
MMMNRVNIFDKYAEEYDAWFDKNSWVYQSELKAVKMLLPQGGKGVEILCLWLKSAFIDHFGRRLVDEESLQSIISSKVFLSSCS